MAEHIMATGSVRARIEAELQAYREYPAHYVQEKHPLVTFVSLDA